MTNVLYISSIDVSLTNGPGVNEREFIHHLYSLIEDNAHFVIPKPEHGLPSDIPTHVFTLTAPHKHDKPLHWIAHHASIVRQAGKLLSEGDFELIVMRVGVFGVGEWILTRRGKTPYALKTAGSGRFEVFERKNVFFRALKPLTRQFLPAWCATR